MKLSELALLGGYEFCGPDNEIKTIRYSHCAERNDIAIIKTEKEIFNTKAVCVLTKPMLLHTDKSMLFSCDPVEIAAVKISKILNKEKLFEIEQNVYDKQVGDFYVGKGVEIDVSASIAPNVYIGNYVKIGAGSVIEPNVCIGSYTVIGKNVHIGMGSSIGARSFYHYYDEGLQEFPGAGDAIISDNVSIGSNTIIQRGTFSDTYIGTGCKIGNLIDIGHDVCIGSNCKIVSQSGIASQVTIDDFVQIYGQSGIANNVKIGDHVTVMAKSVVTKDIRSGQCVSGMYARNHFSELKRQAKLNKLLEEK